MVKTLGCQPIITGSSPVRTALMEIYNRKSIFSELHEYCSFSKKGVGAFMEITEWVNEEGFDMMISNDNGHIEKISLTHGQFDLMVTLYKKMFNTVD